MEARARDLRKMRKMRKHLSAPGLLAVVRAHFERIKEPGRSCRHTLTDNLMCGLALFAFKYPSMLQFDERHRGAAADPVLQHNLARLLWGGDGSVGQQSASAAGPGFAVGVAAGVRSGLRNGASAQGPDGFPGVGRALSAGRGRHRAVCLGAGALRDLWREAAPRWSRETRVRVDRTGCNVPSRETEKAQFRGARPASQHIATPRSSECPEQRPKFCSRGIFEYTSISQLKFGTITHNFFFAV